MYLTEDLSLVPLATQFKYPPLLQTLVSNKLKEAVAVILTDVFKVILASRQMSADAFIDLYVVKKEGNLSDLDQRTLKFFHQLLVVINEKLNKTPNLNRCFELLASYSKDPLIRQKFILKIALPSINKLVKDLDKISPLIIDDINNIKVLPAKLKTTSPKKRMCISPGKVSATAALCAIIACAYLCWPSTLPPIVYDTKNARAILVECKNELTKVYVKPSSLKYYTMYQLINSCQQLAECTLNFYSDNFLAECKPLNHNAILDLNISYNAKELHAQGEAYLKKMENLIQRKCCFYISSRATLDPKLEYVNIQATLNSHCAI